MDAPAAGRKRASAATTAAEVPSPRATAHVSKKRKNKHRVSEEARASDRVGNFRRYYAYRLGQDPAGSESTDPRLTVLDRSWFEHKQGLDVGCNAGVLTIALARTFEPSHLMGIDVDADLLRQARANLREHIHQHRVQKAFGVITEDSSANTKPATTVAKPAATDKEETKDPFADDLPVSFRLWKAPVQHHTSATTEVATVDNADRDTGFPFNVVFKREDALADTHSRSDYDFIICFSVTKWIHLFHGDDGIKQLFAKLYKLLRPGGRLVLEPQPWKSYHKRKFTSDVTAATYDQIQLRPKDFPDYLTQTVGFRSCTLLKVCETSTRGFRRPVYVLEK